MTSVFPALWIAIAIIKYQVLCNLNRPALLFVIANADVFLFLRMLMFQLLSTDADLVCLLADDDASKFVLPVSPLSPCRCWWVITSANIDLVISPEGKSTPSLSMQRWYFFILNECKCLFVTLTPIASRPLFCLLPSIDFSKTHNTLLIISWEKLLSHFIPFTWFRHFPYL